MRQFFTVLLLSGFALATPLNLRVADSSGEPMKDVLVIVVNLDRGTELSRQLTDEQGRIPKREMQTGLYRAIATVPYGPWTTSVKEFWVSETAADVELMLKPLGTRGYGDIVTLGTTTAVLQVIAADGKAASGAEIVVRDREATLHLERRYKADSEGRTEIELVADPTVVVVAFGGNVKSIELASTEKYATIRLTRRNDY